MVMPRMRKLTEEQTRKYMKNGWKTGFYRVPVSVLTSDDFRLGDSGSSHANSSDMMARKLTEANDEKYGKWCTPGSIKKFDKTKTVADSIRKYGIRTPLRIGGASEYGYRLQNGHHRLALALAEGIEYVPVAVNTDAYDFGQDD